MLNGVDASADASRPVCRAAAYRRTRIARIAIAACVAVSLGWVGAAANPINPFPQNINAILYVPYVTAPDAGPNGRRVAGTVDIGVAAKDRTGHARDFNDVRFAVTIDGTVASPILSAGSVYNWDTTETGDGGHAIGLVLIDGDGDLSSYRALSTSVFVDNNGTVPTGPINLPTLGNAAGSKHFYATPDYVTVDPTAPVPGATPASLVPVYSAPVHQQAARFVDPFDAHNPANWFVESLTQSNTGLYTGEPMLFLNGDGTPVIETYLPQQIDDPVAVQDPVLRQPTRPGERNDNVVSAYATYTPDPTGPGFYGVDLAGWVYHVDETGKITTIAGREVIPGTVPLNYRDDSIDQQTLADHQVRWVGDFGHVPGGGHGGGSGSDAVVPCQPDHVHRAPPLCNSHDIAVDPRDPKVLYVADTGNHIITKIDRNFDPPRLSIYAGTRQTAGNGDGTGEGNASFSQPTSIAMRADGTMYVADKGNNSIRMIAPDGTVSTVRSGLEGPFALRLDSNENLVFSEVPSARIWRLDTGTGMMTGLADGHDSNWVWLDVDRHGNIGPVDDILFASSVGGANNAHIFRISKNGAADRIDEFLPNSSVQGAAPHGPARIVSDPHGHYPWVLTIDDEQSKILTQGYGNGGLRILRLTVEGDPTKASYDHTLYGRGRSVMLSGTAFGFPFDARPSFTALRSESGHSFLGLPTFDELALMADADLAAYIRSGFGGAVPRPEITCTDMDALIYYVRVNSVLGMTTEVSPPPSSCQKDTVEPVFGDISYRWTQDGFEINWETDKDTLGFVGHGVSSNLHRWSSIENDFGTNHVLYLNTLPEPGSDLFFRIYARDRYGNLVESDLISLNIEAPPAGPPAGSPVPAPAVWAIFAVAALSLGRIRQRRPRRLNPPRPGPARLR